MKNVNTLRNPHILFLVKVFRQFIIQWGNCPSVFPSYRFQEGLCLVEAIKLFVLHHQEMSSIDDYSLQTNKRTQ